MDFIVMVVVLSENKFMEGEIISPNIFFNY